MALILSTSFIVFKMESEKRELQDELIELSKVKYGMFSVDEWEEILSTIITKRINDFDLEDTNQEKLKEKISDFLQIAIDELEVAYNEEEGFLKRTGATVFGVFGHMEKKIPEITESIVEFMNDPENRERIKEYLLKKMSEYSEETFAEINYTAYDLILAKHQVQTKQQAIGILKNKIATIEHEREPFTIALFTIITLLFVLVAFSADLKKTEFTILTIICGVLLLVGVLLPMINIDARVSEMNFQLLGEEISFNDQVLYFKSKSILEVVMLMLSQSKIDVLVVGFLVLLFSVLFPVSKLTTSLFYLYRKKARESKVAKFLVFKTAKWSMADVMVVAIFMAFIGFSGIVSEQLRDLESIALNVEIFTTNASSLQIGFFLFTSFAVLSTLVSYKLQYSFNDDKKISGAPD